MYPDTILYETGHATGSNKIVKYYYNLKKIYCNLKKMI